MKRATTYLFDHQDDDNPLYFEAQGAERGYSFIAGVDEAGRGPLAGPVVAAAVILKSGSVIEGVRDSKKLTPQKRDYLYDIILNEAVSVGIGICSHDTIDRINILQASLAAMKQAIKKLSPSPDYLLIDGTFRVPIRLPQLPLVKGDDRSMSIAAASIVAKVTRDRIMVDMDSEHPGYGFAEHKGYGCAAHLAAISQLGPCPIHRKTFSGVKEHYAQLSEKQLPLV